MDPSGVALGAAGQGHSVALYVGGNTAIVGAPRDNSFVGAAWVFTRSGGVWSQQGSKLVGTGAVNPAEQGFSLALSCNTAIVGGPQDNTQQGAAWAFVAPPTSTHDFNGGCLSDILWRDNSGSVAIWLMNGPSVLQSGTLGAVDSNWAIAETGDFNGTARLTFSGAIRTPTIRTIRTTGWW